MTDSNEMCNRCEEAEAVVDWGICADCFFEEVNERTSEILDS